MFGFGKRKIKLEEHQHNVVVGFAEELGIPKEEVLWIFIEFGQMLLVASQKEENKDIYDQIDKRSHLPEYKHWKEIAKLNLKCIETYEKHEEEIKEQNK